MIIEVKEKQNQRIDLFLSDSLNISRTKTKKIIDNVLVNNKPVNPSYIVKENDIISINDSFSEEDNIDVSPEAMELDIVYEDEYLLVINKKSGVVVHPAVGNYHHTLVNGLLYYFNDKNEHNLIRPGIVHRIDKDTSGLMIVAKTEKMLEVLSSMIKNKEVERKYVALVYGILKHDCGTIDAPIGRDINNRQKYCITNLNAKDAVTHFKVIERLNNATLIECILDTGRTHQIRVHMNYINHPIVNDLVYSSKKLINKDFGQMLHSKSLTFIHPVTKEEITLEVDPPKEFLEILETFKD